MDDDNDNAFAAEIARMREQVRAKRAAEEMMIANANARWDQKIAENEASIKRLREEGGHDTEIDHLIEKTQQIRRIKDGMNRQRHQHEQQRALEYQRYLQELQDEEWRRLDYFDVAGKIGTAPICAQCDQQKPAMFVCGHCSQVVYCGQKCADAHWKKHVQ
jgi:hypothetical protein